MSTPAPTPVLPGPRGLPLVGNFFATLTDPLGFAERTYRRYGEVVHFHNGPLRGVALYGPEANRFVLVEAADNFLLAPLFDQLGARWIVGQGLLVIDDPAHRQQRRLVTPAFHHQRIAGYQQTMRAATTEWLDRLSAGAVLDLNPAFQRLAVTVAGRCFFGLDLAGRSGELGAAIALVLRIVGDPLQLALTRLPFNMPGGGGGAGVRRALARLDAVLGQIIAEHARTGADSGDIVSMLVAARDEAGASLRPEQIRDHLLSLFVAGQEAMAQALTWACYLLAQHPAVTTRLLDELQQELAGAAPMAADLERLPYLDQVVKEALRLFPPVPSPLRVARAAFTWQGYRVPAGSIVNISPYVTHHMARYFPEPHTFRPERFDPAQPPPAPYSYLPFSVGPRSCVGASFATMAVKTVLAMVFQRYRLDLVAGQRVEATARITLQAKEGLRVRVQPQDGRVERSPAAVRGNVVGATPGPR
jgi:cytochrome P450